MHSWKHVPGTSMCQVPGLGMERWPRATMFGGPEFHSRGLEALSNSMPTCMYTPGMAVGYWVAEHCRRWPWLRGMESGSDGSGLNPVLSLAAV